MTMALLASLDATAIELPPDPTTSQDYACFSQATYDWDDGSLSGHDGKPVGSVRGRVVWPVQCGGSSAKPITTLPLVLVAHGNDHHYTDYNHLLRHLAANGFIAASISTPNSVEANLARAERIRSWLGFLRHHWTWKTRVQNRIGLLGHSRGGEAVLTATRKMADWGLDHRISAVLSLAPTDTPTEGGGTEGPESLSLADTDAYMVLYGSDDEDVIGRDWLSLEDVDCRVVPAPPMRTGFALFDRSGSEVDTLPPFLPGADPIDKLMLFVDKANHNCWRDTNCSGPITAKAMHHAVFLGYSNAFFRWHLRDQSAYRYYLTGDWMPAEVANKQVRVRHQYVEGYGRRVIDNFEQGGWAAGTIGSVTRSSALDLSVSEDPSAPYFNCTSPHDTGALTLSWSRANAAVIPPWIRWNIPSGVDHGGRRWRDLSPFTHLSLRVGQIWGSPANTEGEAQRFSVVLIDENGARSRPVPSRLFAELAYPEAAASFHGHEGTRYSPKSSMQTLRMPLAYASNVRLGRIAGIELRFDDPERLTGHLMLDSLELVTAQHNVLGIAPTELVNELAINQIEGAQGSERYFYLDVPEDAWNLRVSIQGSRGDADLYLRYALDPTSEHWDCRPFSGTSTEACEVALPAPGRWKIMLRGFRAFEDVKILARFDRNAPPCVDCIHVEDSLSGTGDADVHPDGNYYYAPAGMHRAWLEGPEDADFDLHLYQWTGGAWRVVASATGARSEEQIAFDAWEAGYYYWEVSAYRGSGDYALWLELPE